MNELADLVAPEEVDLLALDTASGDWQTLAQLAEFAQSRLRKEGLALAATTPGDLAEAWEAVRPFLKLWWVFAVCPADETSAAASKGIVGKWRAVLALTRGGTPPIERPLFDLLTEEHCHEWARRLEDVREAPIAALAEHLTKPGAAIVQIFARANSMPWQVFPAEREGVSIGIVHSIQDIWG